jgi:hemerythrin-like domain-containing protein
MQGKMSQQHNGTEPQAPSGFEDVGELVAVLRAHHANKLHLCEELEAIADSLPDRLGPKECLAAARRVVATMHDAHEFEDLVLWPVLRAMRPDDVALEECLQRLYQEHVEDESYADELAAVLTDHAMCVGECNAEAMGYMLRGFFGGVRRHIAFEREHIAPILETSVKAGQ